MLILFKGHLYWCKKIIAVYIWEEYWNRRKSSHDMGVIEDGELTAVDGQCDRRMLKVSWRGKLINGVDQDWNTYNSRCSTWDVLRITNSMRKADSREAANQLYSCWQERKRNISTNALTKSMDWNWTYFIYSEMVMAHITAFELFMLWMSCKILINFTVCIIEG